jgi:hypothetical protein
MTREPRIGALGRSSEHGLVPKTMPWRQPVPFAAMSLPWVPALGAILCAEIGIFVALNSESLDNGGIPDGNSH